MSLRNHSAFSGNSGMTSSRPAVHRNLYGRRRGKRLKPSRAVLLETDLPKFLFQGASAGENPCRETVDLERQFGAKGKFRLEIGFGSGEHLIQIADSHPEIGLIGCEPFISGVASLLAKLRSQRMSNIRIYPGDVRDVLDVLPDGSISLAYLLYPDPWPKKRHHRRRFVTPEFLRPLARVLECSAEFRIATDVPDYTRQTIEQVPRDGLFEWTARRCCDWMRPWTGWLPTRYEQKAVANGGTPVYMTFIRTRVKLHAAAAEQDSG